MTIYTNLAYINQENNLESQISIYQKCLGKGAQSKTRCLQYLNQTRKYGLLRSPTSISCGGIQPLAETFFALGQQKAYHAISNFT